MFCLVMLFCWWRHYQIWVRLISGCRDLGSGTCYLPVFILPPNVLSLFLVLDYVLFAGFRLVLVWCESLSLLLSCIRFCERRSVWKCTCVFCVKPTLTLAACASVAL
jgi:hypothetical protein